MKDSLIILLSFAVGVALALTGVIPADLNITLLSKCMLYLLMFLVGINIGLDKKIVQLIKSQPLRMLFLPLSTMAGTFAGAVIAFFILKFIHQFGLAQELGIIDSLSVSAGFGYYSLSSILLNEARGAELGTIALAANIIRELLTITLAPLMARYFSRFAPISCGGATTMDTTLPIIQKTCGNEYVPISIYHGIVMDFSVPLYVTLFISLS